MKPRKTTEPRAEYDFSTGTRGKYAASVARASNVIVLDPDVARRFKTGAAVNRALREQMTRRRKTG